MADKKRSAKRIQKKIIFEQPRNRWVDFLRLDESYTSLILGIIVVIIASILLVSFVKNQHSIALHQQTSSISTGPMKLTHNIPLTISPTLIATTLTPEVTVTPTKKALATITIKPTTIPVAIATEKPTIISSQQEKGGGTYIVKPGDDLWHIAEKIYGSGYNWVDIANINHLTNPSTIYSGNILQLPEVAPKFITQVHEAFPSIQSNNNIAQYGTAITTNTYVVQKGDSLWTISQRAYKGNGYEWPNIAKINHLVTPDIIYSGNVLQLPR